MRLCVECMQSSAPIYASKELTNQPINESMHYGSITPDDNDEIWGNAEENVAGQFQLTELSLNPYNLMSDSVTLKVSTTWADAVIPTTMALFAWCDVEVSTFSWNMLQSLKILQHVDVENSQERKYRSIYVHLKNRDV